MSNPYVTFADVAGLVHAGSSIQLSAPVEPDAYISLTDDRDIVAFLKVRPDARLSVSSRLDQTWKEAGRVAVSEDEELRAEISFPPEGTRVAVNGAVFLLPPVRKLNYLKALAGVGGWKVSVSDGVEADAGPLSVELPSMRDTPAEDRGLIFDLGLHNGSDTEFYLKKGFRVLAVEANPLLARAARLNFRPAVEDGSLVILNAGLAATRGRATFHVNKVHSEWSSFVHATASRGHPVEPVEVETITPNDLFFRYGVPYYAKIDIEGHDHLVVKSIAELPLKPRYVSFENGQLPHFELLAKSGYDAFKFVNQRLVPEMRCPEPPLEGERSDHEFPAGSSGPFGEETVGAWSGAEDMREMLTRHHAERAARRGQPDVDWYDLHARRAGAG